MNFIPIIIIPATIFLFERLFPHHKNLDNKISHAISNLSIAIINLFFTTVFYLLVNKKYSLGLLNIFAMSVYLELIVSVIVFDLWMYIWHRVNHKLRFFWIFHRAHHNDINMDSTSAWRFHPVEIILSSIFNIVVLIIIGIKFKYFILYKFLMQPVILFHHSNINLYEKYDSIIRLFIVTPNMHRVHHNRYWKETQTNFSTIFSFWDRLFKTFKKNDNTYNIEYGLNLFREKKWQSFLGFLLIPFKKGS